MKPYRSTLVIAVLLVLASGLRGSAQAGTPTDQLRSEIDQLYQSLQQPATSPSANGASSEVLDRMFNWPQMAQTVMGRHWPQRSAAERAEFTQLFAGMFRRAYVSRIHVVDASKFQYLGDAVDGDRATVKTKVFTKRGSTLDVDYAVRLGDGQRWRVDDVKVERVSLIDNYRTQFDTFLGRSSYEALTQKLRANAK
jgi:phospholipid transport system substrate-binding protein